MKDKYSLEILVNENAYLKIAIDERNYTHINKKAIQVIWLIDTQSKEFILEPSYTRDALN